MGRHDAAMDLTVRPAAPDDGGDALLYESARHYYDAYAGDEAAARRMLRRVYRRGGHSASVEVTRVAEAEGRVVGAIVAFPAGDGERLARRFMALTLPAIPPWRWPRLLRHLRAAATVSPAPPPDSWYVDALAVAPGERRRGIARALLADVEEIAREAGAIGVALDTGLENAPARRLYERHGFEERDIRRAPDQRAARAIGGRGFVGYFKPV
jgi:ribosomal protein S18 acetylase RimI-like enzyme